MPFYDSGRFIGIAQAAIVRVAVFIFPRLTAARDMRRLPGNRVPGRQPVGHHTGTRKSWLVKVAIEEVFGATIGISENRRVNAPARRDRLPGINKWTARTVADCNSDSTRHFSDAPVVGLAAGCVIHVELAVAIGHLGRPDIRLVPRVGAIRCLQYRTDEIPMDQVRGMVSDDRRPAKVDEVLPVPLEHERVGQFVLDVAGIADNWICIRRLGFDTRRNRTQKAYVNREGCSYLNRTRPRLPRSSSRAHALT